MQIKPLIVSLIIQALMDTLDDHDKRRPAVINLLTALRAQNRKFFKEDELTVRTVGNLADTVWQKVLDKTKYSNPPKTIGVGITVSSLYFATKKDFVQNYKGNYDMWFDSIAKKVHDIDSPAGTEKNSFDVVDLIIESIDEVLSNKVLDNGQTGE